MKKIERLRELVYNHIGDVNVLDLLDPSRTVAEESEMDYGMQALDINEVEAAESVKNGNKEGKKSKKHAAATRNFEGNYRKPRQGLIKGCNLTRGLRQESSSPSSCDEAEHKTTESYFKTSRYEELQDMADFRCTLERPRKNRKIRKTFDPNFMEEFKIAQKPKTEGTGKMNSARNPFLPPPPEFDKDDYELIDGLWIKRHVSPTANDPFPIKHRALYPDTLYPEPQFATTPEWI